MKKLVLAALAAVALALSIPGTAAGQGVDLSRWVLVSSAAIDGVGRVRCTYEKRLNSGEVLTRVLVVVYSACPSSPDRGF